MIKTAIAITPPTLHATAMMMTVVELMLLPWVDFSAASGFFPDGTSTVLTGGGDVSVLLPFLFSGGGGVSRFSGVCCCGDGLGLGRGGAGIRRGLGGGESNTGTGGGFSLMGCGFSMNGISGEVLYGPMVGVSYS